MRKEIKMSNASDFLIENERLEKYVGTSGDIVIPEGVRYLSYFAFSGTVVTSMVLPKTLYDKPRLCDQKYFAHLTVHEENPYFKCIDDVLYNADVTTLIFCPSGREGELHVPDGVEEISLDALVDCRITHLYLPASVKACPTISPPTLTAYAVDENNPTYKSVDGILYEKATETMTAYPAAKEGVFYLPSDAKGIFLDTFINFRDREFHIHIGADASVKTSYGSDNHHITIYAPEGSNAALYARRLDCSFVAEGEPVSKDDSAERKDRSFQEWRGIFVFSAKSKGISINKYVRGSKVVYLPDKIGKSDVASIDKSAFPADVCVLCSKKLFSKLSVENRISTIRSFLLCGERFTEDEKAYLTDNLKKNRAVYLEEFIKNEDLEALRACFAALPKVKTLMEECLELTKQLKKMKVNFFLLNLSKTLQ